MYTIIGEEKVRRKIKRKKKGKINPNFAGNFKKTIPRNLTAPSCLERRGGKHKRLLTKEQRTGFHFEMNTPPRENIAYNKNLTRI